jgi:hypothetical protein
MSLFQSQGGVLSVSFVLLSVAIGLFCGPPLIVIPSFNEFTLQLIQIQNDGVRGGLASDV